jgi:hypothetical protein
MIWTAEIRLHEGVRSFYNLTIDPIMDGRDFMKGGSNLGHIEQYGWPRFNVPKRYPTM